MALILPSQALKAITIIVPLGAGSSVDTAARLFAAEMARSMGRPVNVELLPGAGGTIGTAKAARAAPDGCTIAIVSNGTHAINMGLYADPGYDPIRDFAPIALAGAVSNVMIMHPDNPAGIVQDVITAARDRPGELTYSSGGTGTTHHFSGVMFASMAEVDLVHVPFAASRDGINQVAEGHVSMGFFNLPTVLAHIKGGTLKALAVTSKTRSRFLPLLPTLDESGLPGYEVTAWFGFAAPAGTPAGLVTQLNMEIAKVLNNPVVRQQMEVWGFELASPAAPETFAQMMKDELARWLPIVKASGAPVE